MNKQQDITTRGIIAKIDTQAITQNYQLLQALAADTEIVPVVKANAYGHGLIPVTQALASYSQRFACARLSEVRQLREQRITQTIIVMSENWAAEDWQQCIALNVQPVIYQPQHIESLLQADLSHALDIWLKVDTGMHRLGFAASTLNALLPKLYDSSNVQSLYIMSHLATADAKNDEFAELQWARFKPWTTQHYFSSASLANSAALLRDKKYHFNVARTGIALYGVNPLFQIDNSISLLTSMELTAEIIALQTLSAGESVGYNRNWYAGRKSTIATIGIGYADGYPRHARNSTPVWIHGQTAPLVGTVSMDMITVDISDIQSHVAIGDRVELFGKHISVNELAVYSHTIAYDIFTGIAGRTQKIYASI